MNPTSDPCRQPGCCGPTTTRREFIEWLGLGTAALAAAQLPAFAGPFELADFEKLVPSDKKLDPAWVASLTARGTPTVYRGAELDKIGMPIGGIGAGQVYLGGDGRLWHWDVFNRLQPTGDAHYAQPPRPTFPFEQGFAIRLGWGAQTRVLPLDRRGFADVTFRGEYPIGRVEYRDVQLPLAVELEAFSPFIPLNTDDSSLPAVVLRFVLRNTGSEALTAELAGWLENAVCLDTGEGQAAEHVQRICRGEGLTWLACSARAATAAPETSEDIVFADFEQPTYGDWQTTGTAFGAGPIKKSKIPAYQGDVNARGQRLVNSHNTRSGEDVARGDAHLGTLTSPAFRLERRFIHLLVGGGAHKDKTCVNLLVDGKVVLSATGTNSNRMRTKTFDAKAWLGKDARIQIVDNESGGWGNIGVDQIVFSDRPAAGLSPLGERSDFGTMTLSLVGDPADARAVAALPAATALPGGVFDAELAADDSAVRPFGEKLIGSLARKIVIDPGAEQAVTFVIAWHFPNLQLDDLQTDGRWYGKRFASAQAVAEYVAEHLDRLARDTRLWRDTWYDSTLPYWFLDRTLANASILATSTCYRFGNGRFYAWEGVGCCNGTCTHVWHYAQAVARLFPALERDTRARVDLGIAFDPQTGVIDFRGEFHNGEAIDGQAGTIVRCYREHQMAADDAFLRKNWPRIRQAMEFLIRKDGNADGVLEGAQHNTLDAAWFGKIPWLSGMYHVALRASEEMAREVGDQAFADTCRKIFETGRQQLDELTWNDRYGYYVQLPDPKELAAVGSFDGCLIDQVLGESWSHQVGLGEIMSSAHVRRALASLWRYNYTPDVGPYRAVHRAGRWYALAGEGGLLMVTHPFGPGPAFKDHPSAWSAMYFNECMTGFEHQVAGHMLAAGLPTEGLAIERSIHDRYHAARRNPWNEVECGDHYARAMASYGVFLSACGYEYHGPRGHLGFAPRLSAADFRAAFTTAEGWGSYRQQRTAEGQDCRIALAHGRLRLKSLSLEMAGDQAPRRAELAGPNGPLAAAARIEGQRVRLTLERDLLLEAGQELKIVIT